VWADPGRVVQVLANLLDNAAKYSPEGSVIAVSWAQEDAHVAVRVRDHGSGIPDRGSHLLFTRFGRIAGIPIRAGRLATGLGLYVSRSLAQAMGGEIDLESTGPSGSVFRLRLPIATAERMLTASQR
jgi:signal transduction histidine kinase